MHACAYVRQRDLVSLQRNALSPKTCLLHALSAPQHVHDFIPMLTPNINLDATERVSRIGSCPAVDNGHTSILAAPIITESW